jgi:hypothetical protein
VGKGGLCLGHWNALRDANDSNNNLVQQVTGV